MIACWPHDHLKLVRNPRHDERVFLEVGIIYTLALVTELDDASVLYVSSQIKMSFVLGTLT